MCLAVEPLEFNVSKSPFGCVIGCDRDLSCRCSFRSFKSCSFFCVIISKHWHMEPWNKTVDFSRDINIRRNVTLFLQLSKCNTMYWMTAAFCATLFPSLSVTLSRNPPLRLMLTARSSLCALIVCVDCCCSAFSKTRIDVRFFFALDI